MAVKYGYLTYNLLSGNENSHEGSKNHSHDVSVAAVNTWLANNMPRNARILWVDISTNSYYTGGLGTAYIYAKAYYGSGGSSGTQLTGEYELRKGIDSGQNCFWDITSYCTSKTYPFSMSTAQTHFSICFSTANILSPKVTCNQPRLAVTYLPTYTATWVNYDNTVLHTQSGVDEGSVPTYGGSTPTRTGYTFNGWSPSMDAMSADTTYTAQFTEHKYTIAFNGNGNTGGSMSSIANVGYDDSTPLTANAFTKTGHTFAGWATSASGSVVYNDKASVSKLTPTNGDTVTLYAKWTPNSYTIKFNSNGGSGTMSDLAMTYNQEKTLTANTFTKRGHSFNGWNTKADGSGTSYSDQASVKNLVASGSISLYAKWKVNTYTLTVTASTGGTVTGGGNYDYGTTAKLTATPVTGYQFYRWSDGNTSNPRTITVEDHATYTATFIISNILINNSQTLKAYLGKLDVKEIYCGKTKVWG